MGSARPEIDSRDLVCRQRGSLPGPDAALRLSADYIDTGGQPVASGGTIFRGRTEVHGLTGAARS